LTLWTPYVRADISGNWTGFTGQLNVTTDVDAKKVEDRGGDFRIANAAGFPNGRIHLQRLVSLQNRAASGSTIALGELAGEVGCNAAAPGGNSGLPVTWSVGGLNTSATFGGNTYHGIGFTKVGTGTWTWTGTNIAHTGLTTINGGTLMMNGNAAAATGVVTVGAAGTLAGTGTLGGNILVNGRLAPGDDGIGTLTCTNQVTFNSGGTAVIEINKSTGARDRLEVGATLTYGGLLQVTNLAGTLAPGDSFKIFEAPAYLGAFASYSLPGLASNLSWDVSALATSGTISVIVTNLVPPGSNLPPALAHYEFEGNAQDSSGNGFHGTPANLAYATGKVGAQAAQLNGSNAYVQIPRSIGDSNFSLAFWIKTTDTGGVGNGQWWNGRGLVDGEVAGSRADFGTALVGDKFAFGVGSPDVTISSTTMVNDGQWHHLAVTRESATGQMILYVDGQAESTGSGPTGAKNAPPSLRLGSLQTGNNFLTGMMDEVRLYGAVLSPAEIWQLAQPPLAPPVFSSITAAGGNLVLVASGDPYGTCRLLAATDVTLPPAAWLPIGTNQFDATGQCSLVVPLNPLQPARFYRLVVP
jgi:autotransporter-associated beta strand protein